MRRFSGALAFVAGAALIIGSTGAAIGQEADPPPDEAATAENAAVEPSSLDIMDVAGDKNANKPLRGKKLQQAVAAAAPAAARYVIAGTGDDAIGRIIGLSLAARAADEAGDKKAAASMIAVARLLYREAWTKAKSDPATLNGQLQEAITAAGYSQPHPALVLASFGEPEMGIENMMDVCVEGDTEFILDPSAPWECTDGGGRQVRADMAFVNPERNGSDDLFFGDPATADVGGLGIHKVTQTRLANDKLPTKKLRKALAKELQKSGAALAGYEAGQRGAIDMLLAARAADEAGDKKAAKSFLNLARAAYRSAVPKPTEGTVNTEALNYEMAQLIEAEYPDTAGLEMVTPEGYVSVCYDPKKQVCYQNAGDHTPWECAQGNTVFTRMPYEEALAANCPEVE